MIQLILFVFISSEKRHLLQITSRMENKFVPFSELSIVPIVQNAQMSNLVLFISNMKFVTLLFRDKCEIYAYWKFQINQFLIQ